MADESEGNTGATPNTDGAPFVQNIRRDGVLANLVQAVNAIDSSATDSHLEVGVILVVDGVSIAGQLVGGRTWMDYLAEKQHDIARTSDADPDAVAALGNFLAQPFEAASEVLYSSYDLSGPSPTYLHLKDARLLPISSDTATWNEMWLRVGLEHVSAWTLGTFRSS